MKHELRSVVHNSQTLFRRFVKLPAPLTGFPDLHVEVAVLRRERFEELDHVTAGRVGGQTNLTTGTRQPHVQIGRPSEHGLVQL